MHSFSPENKLLSGHDISEGGFITTLLEMGIAGVRGLNLNINLPGASPIEALFNEELGIVLEVASNNLEYVLGEYKTNAVFAQHIGFTGKYGMDAPVCSILLKLNLKFQYESPTLP